MKKYLDRLHAKEPHQKREFAAHAAAVLTGIVFLVWVSTLGARLANSGASATTVANTDASTLVAATAGAGAAFQNQVQSYSEQQQATPTAVQSVGQNTDSTNQNVYAATTTDTSNTSGATVIGSPDSPATTLNQ